MTRVAVTPPGRMLAPRLQAVPGRARRPIFFTYLVLDRAAQASPAFAQLEAEIEDAQYAFWEGRDLIRPERQRLPLLEYAQLTPTVRQAFDALEADPATALILRASSRHRPLFVEYDGRRLDGRGARRCKDGTYARLSVEPFCWTRPPDNASPGGFHHGVMLQLRAVQFQREL